MTVFEVMIHLTDNEEEALKKFKTLTDQRAISIKQRFEKGSPFIYEGKPVFIVKFKSKREALLIKPLLLIKSDSC